MKSAAAAWLADRGEQATFTCTRPEDGPLGSVVDVRWRHGALRVHLDQAVASVWDDYAVEPVLGTMVPVDRDTLVRRWYVHRIRLDSEGTARRVRIGTEAFARPTEWFALNECDMTERGLFTPAVDRIIRSRSTPPPARPATRTNRKSPDARTRTQVLFRRIEEARAVGSVVVVARVSHTLATLDGVDQETRAQIDTVLQDAKGWLQEQTVVRKEMFAQLSETVAEGKVQEARGLLARVNAIAAHDRTDSETRTARTAATFLAGVLREHQETARRLNAAAEAKEEARRQTARQKTQALQRVRTTLRTLRRHGRTMPGRESGVRSPCSPTWPRQLVINSRAARSTRSRRGRPACSASERRQHTYFPYRRNPPRTRHPTGAETYRSRRARPFPSDRLPPVPVTSVYTGLRSEPRSVL
ncbi:hypothetical protein ACOMD4_11235 [Streptomyces anulatus]|uniref:hypothetical protein n=1 Tax=Streptomyces anulatus TaxID=1892 RepID=UPI003B77A027